MPVPIDLTGPSNPQDPFLPLYHQRPIPEPSVSPWTNLFHNPAKAPDGFVRQQRGAQPAASQANAGGAYPNFTPQPRANVQLDGSYQPVTRPFAGQAAAADSLEDTYERLGIGQLPWSLKPLQAVFKRQELNADLRYSGTSAGSLADWKKNVLESVERHQVDECQNHLHPRMRLSCYTTVMHLVSSACEPNSHAQKVAMHLRPALLDLAAQWDAARTKDPCERPVTEFLITAVWPVLDVHLTGGTSSDLTAFITMVMHVDRGGKSIEDPKPSAFIMRLFEIWETLGGQYTATDFFNRVLKGIPTVLEDRLAEKRDKYVNARANTVNLTALCEKVDRMFNTAVDELRFTPGTKKTYDTEGSLKIAVPLLARGGGCCHFGCC